MKVENNKKRRVSVMQVNKIRGNLFNIEKSFEQLSLHKPVINRNKSILAPKDTQILRVFTIDLGV